MSGREKGWLILNCPMSNLGKTKNTCVVIGIVLSPMVLSRKHSSVVYPIYGFFKSLKSHITLLIQLSVLLYLYTLHIIKYSHFKLTPLNSDIYIIVLLLAKAFVRGCYE